MRIYTYVAYMTNQNTTWEIFLFADSSHHQPKPEEPESHDIGTYHDEQALNAALRHAAQTPLPTRGIPQCLSVMRTNRKVLPDTAAVRAPRETLQHLAARNMGLEYAYYSERYRESRLQNIMSFFLITYPDGEPVPHTPPHFSWLFQDYYKGQFFALTPDQCTLEELLETLPKTHSRCKSIRIDYFSTGSFIRWEMPPETIAALAATGCGLSLHIHPAMLTADTDSIYPLVSYILRSKVWREILMPIEDS